MIKLQTIVEVGRSKISISLQDKVMVIGSCFADNIGNKMLHSGLNVYVNPFGTLYNPVSVCNSLQRLATCITFNEEDCMEMGAGAGLICSFSHHTSFARKTASEFLDNANKVLEEASDFYKSCNKVIVTLGTSWCYNLKTTGETVSNCLKRNAAEFSRERLSLSQINSVLSRTLSRFTLDGPEIKSKEFIFTVSPIRHLSDGAHGNQISKSLLLMAGDSLCDNFPDSMDYFPSYEIMMDELRDYRFYADDMTHPSELAVNYLWERFKDFSVPDHEKEKLLAAEKLYRKSLHRQIH